MRKFGLAACLLAAWLIQPGTVQAGIVDAPGKDLRVSLITYGPGSIYWERFGHDAIEIRDTVSGQAVNFNYGVFDFDQHDFFLNFARGYMHYMIDAERSDADEREYIEAGRSVTTQRLSLEPAQAAQLRDFLLWNLEPQNARYDYDYLVDNCATRVRDALNAAVGGAIRRQITVNPGAMTYRQQITRLMSAEPWLMLAMDLGLGPTADRPLNGWQESFLPRELARQLRTVRIGDGRGGSEPLVQAERLVSPNRLDPPPRMPPDLRLPFLIAGLAFAGMIVAARKRSRTAYAVAGSLYLVAAGFVGLVLLGLWTLTRHHAAWENANLLLFSPLAFGLLPAVRGASRDRGPSRLANGLVAVQLSAVVIAALMHLLPGTVQQNQPWLLLSVPAWGALAWSLRTTRTRA